MNFQSIPATQNDRLMLLLALLLLVLLTAAALFARPLTPIDETRYVGVAWEMWLRGDFLVPFKNGEPYSHKPPLMMWMFQLGWLIFGMNEWWPRLVSPLFSAGGLLLTMGLAKRLWPRHSSVGGQAVLILASSLLWTVFSTAVMFDVMFTFFVLLGMHGILIAADGKRGIGFVLFGLAIGLGVLAKGPVILLQLLPAAVLAPWWNPGLRWTRWFAGLLAAVLLGAAIALVWAIPAGIAGGAEYRNAIFWGQTANRMVESFAHRRPFWWYVPLLPVLLFPWFLWPGLWRAVMHYARQNLDRGGRFCIAWVLPVFLAFSFISGKQVHYLVPLFPAFALFVARALENGSEDGMHPGRAWLPVILIAITGVILLMLSQGMVALPHDEFPELPSIWPGAFMLLVGITALVLSRQCAQPLILMSLMGVMFPALMQIAIVRPLYASYDVRPIAHAIRQVQDGGHVVAHIGKYHNQYQFFGRLKQPLVELKGDAWKVWLLNHPAAYAVVYVKDTGGLQGTPAIVTQRYRGKVAALLDAQTALRFLGTPVALGTQ